VDEVDGISHILEDALEAHEQLTVLETARSSETNYHSQLQDLMLVSLGVFLGVLEIVDDASKHVSLGQVE